MSVAVDNTIALPRPSASAGRGFGVLLWPAVTLAIGATLVTATYGGLEATALGAIVAAAVLATVVAKPEIGILLLTTNYLIASYPTPLRGNGLLTINNLLGIILAVLLVAKLAQNFDFWFLRNRQVKTYLAIGVVLIIGTLVSSYLFPNLVTTRGKFRFLDQTAQMSQDFVTRFAFLIFTLNFLSTKTDLKRVVTVTMLCLLMVVPSALLGYASGVTVGGRAAAAFSLGTNPNRLAFLCLFQIPFWWYFIRSKRSTFHNLLGTAVIGSLIMTVFLTASRSGVLGLGMVFYMLTQKRAGLGGGRLQVIALGLVAIGVLLTVIPQEKLDRMSNINPFSQSKEEGAGAHSTERRVETVEVGWRMFGDYPWFGVGIGNFREVAKQVYQDEFFRPPHNSYVWALTEGGIFCFLLYLLLFWFTWRDIKWIDAAPSMPPELRWIGAALSPALILLMFYSAFADIWLSPVTYILIGLVIVFKRYLSGRRAVLA